MKTLKIFRLDANKFGTFGEYELINASGDVLLKGKTCEPAGEPTYERNKNRPLPAGEYKADMTYSPKYTPRYKGRKVPLVYSDKCPRDRCIRIHIGNWSKDTLGCILLGRYFLHDEETKQINGIGKSTEAVMEFLDELKDESFEIEIY